ncbi:MAG: DUF6644 family protein [Bryobacteraceae bacterium]|jgi:hypothetical protein
MMAISLLPVFEWMEATPVAQAIRHSAKLIALLESVHLIGLTLLLGTIVMVDLSVLGFGIGHSPASRIARELRGWTAAGLVIMLISGPLLLSSEALRCYRTPAFWIKMALLAIALIFHFTLHGSAVSEEPPRERARWTAGLSLALWIGVAFAGKAIAIFQPPD